MNKQADRSFSMDKSAKNGEKIQKKSGLFCCKLKTSRINEKDTGNFGDNAGSA